MHLLGHAGVGVGFCALLQHQPCCTDATTTMLMLIMLSWSLLLPTIIYTAIDIDCVVLAMQLNSLNPIWVQVVTKHFRARMKNSHPVEFLQ